MKRQHQKWRVTVFSVLLLILLFCLILTHNNKSSSLGRSESEHDVSSTVPTPPPSTLSLAKLPKLAYLISGTSGQVPQVKRLIQALYHPRNYYLIHLDVDASVQERLEIARFAKFNRRLRNVMVVGIPDLITPQGPTATAALLHAVALLFKHASDWDWFFNLNASDYPLFSQDDILHIFSYLPRDLNFLEHKSDIGWKEHQRARPIIIDPGLYQVKKASVFWAKEKRSMPSSFKLFTGSEWVVLTKSFLDFCIWGRDNLPRTLLMYYTNFLSSSEGYFHTVVCNNKNFQNTTVNHDLRYMKWDNPPNQQPVNLTQAHYNDMVQSGALFARKFAMNDPVLDRIDRDLLRRTDGHFVPGGWCLENPVLGKDPCAYVGNPDVVKPSENAKRLEKFVLQLLDPGNFRSKQCR